MMTRSESARTVAQPARASASGANLLALSWARVLVELKTFFRTPEAVFFVFLLPVLFVVIFSTVFTDEIDGPPGTTPVPFPQYFVAGMIAAGIMSNTFASLAQSVSLEQHEGLLKRLSGTPLPRTAYFTGKIGLAVSTSALQTAVILAIGVAFFDMTLPSGALRWLAFAWVFVLSVASGALLGIAYTRLIPNASTAATIVQPPYLTLQFISGVFFPYQDIPTFLRVVASIFPLKWMVQGFRYVFLPDWVAEVDYGTDWQLEWVVVALVAWLVASFVLSRRFFRWNRERES
jgi:ABC-2 type transport system permease protein